MKKHGFTLIELLAVIVVLAIIAIIAIPIITNVIDKAKMGALKDSGYGIIDAAEMYLAKNMDKEKNTMEFICNNGTCLSGTEEITYKGQIETGRIRIYSDSKIELCIENDNASALKTVASKEVVVSKGSCNYEELNYGVTALISKTVYDNVVNELNELKTLLNQTDITAEDIKEGKKAYSNGEVITGTYKGMRKIYLGGEESYDLKTNYATYGLNEEDYKNITVDNFIIVNTSNTTPFNANMIYGYYSNYTKSYSNGILTVHKASYYYAVSNTVGYHIYIPNGVYLIY